MSAHFYGGIEAGGTKFVCAVADERLNIQAHIEIPTTSPQETLARVIKFFSQQPPLLGLGIAAFGPIELNPDSPNYGLITSAPKQGWSNTNIVEVLKNGTSAPIKLSTDVNCAALAEHSRGAGKDLSSLLYITVGTGIGGANIVENKLLAGFTHQEIGHMFIARVPEDSTFAGTCPYHGDCLEGLASGPAIQARWQTLAKDLPADHQGWEIEARYLAFGVCNLIVATAPERIVIGGGVMSHPGLIDRVRTNVKKTLNNYLDVPQITDSLEDYIVLPQLGALSGVTGALILAVPA